MPKSSAERLDRIALFHHGTRGWSAGPSFLRMLAHSVGAACAARGIELYALMPPDDLTAVASTPAIPVEVDDRRPRRERVERRLRRLAGKPARSPIVRAAERLGVSVTVLSANFPDEAFYLTSVGWIPDFQHVHLPQYFVEQELRDRDRDYLALARRAELMLLNSEDALRDFRAFAPSEAAKGRVAPFPSLYAFEPPRASSRSAVQALSLPEKFVLVANQFWQHKNHGIVLEAVRLLRDQGTTVPVVMTGLPSDMRDPLNRPISEVLQTIARERLADRVRVLGLVSRQELTDLLRAAALVVQPSRFEGWSTLVQDCKALGRPLLCSDIGVHREQAPDALGFFPCDAPEVLADHVSRHWESLAPGPDLEAEQAALAAEQEFARAHGRRLLAICEEAYAVGRGAR